VKGGGGDCTHPFASQFFGRLRASFGGFGDSVELEHQTGSLLIPPFKTHTNRTVCRWWSGRDGCAGGQQCAAHTVTSHTLSPPFHTHKTELSAGGGQAETAAQEANSVRPTSFTRHTLPFFPLSPTLFGCLQVVVRLRRLLRRPTVCAPPASRRWWARGTQSSHQDGSR
jgi:hypothetical protein